MLTRRHLIAVSAASALAPSLLCRAARADSWPERPVHMIVPIAAGGPTDTNARLIADQLSKTWGQQVVVENRSGAGTTIGDAYVAHADPDGYTVLYGTSSLAVNAALYHSLDYNPLDLAPVSLIAKFPFFMFVPNSSPAKTVSEFVDEAKSHPGRLIMGSPGAGSGPHLAEQYFLQMAKIQMTHAPYRGAAPAFVDLIPGRIDCYFGSGELLNFSRSGQVRVLGSSGARRSPAAPEVPTIAESGVPGYVVNSWQGIFAPAKTPPEIMRKMNAGVVKALAEPAIIQKLAQNAYAVESSSPEELRKFLRQDIYKWNAVITAANIKID